MQKRDVVIVNVVLLLTAVCLLYTALRHSSVVTTKVYAPEQTQDASSVCGAAQKVIVTNVIDGDTVIVSGGYHVRLLGINADETGGACYGAAKSRLQELVLNKEVTLEKDISEVDKYRRCLRNIFINNENIGIVLAREGLVKETFYAPDGKYRDNLSLAEDKAKESAVGCLWSKK